jgi:hypothetical protein
MIANKPDTATSRQSIWQLLKRWTGVDRAIAFTIMARVWSAAAGLLTVLLIVRFLTPGEQGYYYTFASVVALQVIFELGFSFVVLQLAAHERAQLIFLPDGVVQGDAVSHSRLASILQKSVRWYSVAAILMIAVLLPAGLHFFGAPPNSEATVAWKAPWVLLTAATVLTFQIDPIFSFLEGCGFISNVAWMRMGQAMLGSIFAWLAMVAHRGLFSPAMEILGQAVVGAAFLLVKPYRRLLAALWSYRTDTHSIGWRQEIWPFQWRIALSWLSGVFIYQLVNPILFRFQGPAEAGRMGMSLSIVGAIAAVAISWMSTKASPFGGMIARREYVNLDRLFFRTCWQSTILLVVGDIAFLVVLVFAGGHFPHLAARVVQPWAIALMMFTALASHIAYCQALYLRSHKREPFLGITVIGAFLIGGSTYLLGRLWGVNAIVVGNFVLSLVYSLPAGTYIFMTRRREWRATELQNAAG